MLFRVFIAMLGTAVLTLLLIFIILTVELVAYYTDKHNGDILIFYEGQLNYYVHPYLTLRTLMSSTVHILCFC